MVRPLFSRFPPCRWCTRFVGLAVAGGMVVAMAGAAPARAAGVVFSDTLNHWAEQSIDYMSSKGVVLGYSTGRFEPERAVSRYEVVAMLVRVLGADSAAKARQGIPDVFHDTTPVPPWAVGYVGEAVQRGILQGDDLRAFNGWGRANRLDVGVWLVRALGFNEAAREAAAAPFNDVAGVPADKRGSLAVLSEKGLMGGSQGKFRPFDQITRAEIAAIMARADRMLQNDLDRNEFRGSVVAGGNTLTLKLGDGSERAFPLDGAAGVYFEGVKAASNILTAGDYATVVLNGEGRAMYVEAVSQGVRAEGTITTVTSGAISSRSVEIRLSDGKTKTFQVSAGASILLDGRPAVYSQLKSGQTVVVEAQGSVASRIEARSQAQKARGEITSVVILPRGEAVLGVTLGSGSDAVDRVYQVAAGTPVTRNGASARLFNLQAKDRVVLHLVDDRVVRLAVFSYERQVKGTLKAISFGATPEIQVDLAADSQWAAQNDDGSALAHLPVAKEVKVDKDDSRVGLTALRGGDEVTIDLEGDEVVAIEATTRYTSVEGNVVRLTIADPYEITLQKTDGQTANYRISRDVTVRYGNERATLFSVKPGDMVTLTVAYDTVTTIRGSVRGTLDDMKGVVRYLDTTERTFVLEMSGGNTRNVKPGSNFLIIRFGQTRDRLSYLEEGDAVIVVGKDVPGEPFSAQTIVVTGTGVR